MPYPPPPQLARNFTWTGRYEVPDLGVEVPFTWNGNDGNLQMIAGGESSPIHFTNLIYDGTLYTLTYKWPDVERRPCSPLGPFTLHDLNMALQNSRFVGAEILERREPIPVNHFRVGVVWEPPPEVIPPIPGISNLRIPLMSGDIYVDREDPTSSGRYSSSASKISTIPSRTSGFASTGSKTIQAPSSSPMSVQPLRHHPHLRVSGTDVLAGLSKTDEVSTAERMPARPQSVEELSARLGEQAYLADRGLGTAIFLSLSLGQPLLLEGEAGVGKTEVAKALAPALGAELVRLQCYEGIDAHQALYEWDYTRQLLYVRLLQEGRELREDAADEIFGPRFLVERPLLQAVRAGDRAVLLIDEIDRADDEFEAFLLEMLSDFQVTVPELGTIRAERPPAVVLTSNRTRELHDALKRRCLYHWIDYPSLDREVEILAARAPTVPADLARRVAGAVDRIRTLDLVKAPGVAETIEWAKALAFLGATRLERDAVDVSLGTVVKDHDDLVRIRDDLGRILADD